MPSKAIKEPKMRMMTKKHHTSKYDFVKIRIWLTDAHYYILSRFLVWRFLTSTQLKSSHALRISLELKKRLVDAHQLDCTQTDMEQVIFNLMKVYHYGEDYVRLYRMMSRFHHERIPLLVLIAGTRCVGKSPIARKLSKQLNLPSVLHMDIIYEMYCKQEPIWSRSYDDLNDSKFLEDYKKESEDLRRCIEPEIQKCLEEGKALIIEGFHLNYEVFGTWLQNRARKAIIVPFLLHPEYPPHHHETLVRKWHEQEEGLDDPATTNRKGKSDECYQITQIIQNYLLKENKNAFFHLTHVHVDSQRETIQWMHRTILDQMTRYFSVEQS